MTPCDTCAFGKTGAATEPRNRLAGMICALAGMPFFCHHTRSGDEPKLETSGDLFTIPPQERRLCEGWKKRIAGLTRHGHFTFAGISEYDHRLLRRYQKHLGGTALRELDAFLAETDVVVKEKHRAELGQLVAALRNRD